jgi:hypothetical protein
MGAAAGGDTGGMGLLGSTVSPGQRPVMGFGSEPSIQCTTAGLLSGGGDSGGMGLLGSTVSPGQRPVMGFGIDLSGHSTTAGLLSGGAGALLSAAGGDGGGGVSVVWGGHAGLSGVKPQSTTAGGGLLSGSDAGGGVYGVV